jgi:UDP-N-acetylglucosamine 2-epimerase (non-hydrolysing)
VPITLALRASRTDRPVVVSTGQHNVIVQQVLALADIEPDVDLYVGDARADLNERVPTTIRRFDDFFRAAFPGRPDRMLTADEALGGRWPVAVLVHGDTSSALAAALASFHRRTPVVHVEAGLRTGGYNWSAFPEELNRQLITCIATFHLAPTEANEENLVRENVPANQIFVTGNTGIDALQWAAGLDVPFDDAGVAELYEGDARIVLVTAHRRENWGGGLARIGEGVARLARSHPDVRFIVARHPNPRVRAELSGPLESLDNVLLTDTLAYASFARLQKRCHLAITDSGGIQEEAPSLGNRGRCSDPAGRGSSRPAPVASPARSPAARRGSRARQPRRAPARGSRGPEARAEPCADGAASLLLLDVTPSRADATHGPRRQTARRLRTAGSARPTDRTWHRATGPLLD